MSRQSEIGQQLGEPHGVAEPHKPSLKERAVHEAKSFFVIFVYLFVLFGLFVLYEDTILAHAGITRGFTPYGFAVVNALIFAKVMLVADDLHLGRRFEQMPLIYPIVFKAVIFAVVLMGFHVVEELVIGMLHGETAAESIPRIGGGSLKGVVTVGTLFAVQLTPYFAFSEIRRTIGRDELYALLFTRGQAPLVRVRRS
jgi:hypothetical protein